jgi:hypothetical protein
VEQASCLFYSRKTGSFEKYTSICGTGILPVLSQKNRENGENTGRMPVPRVL